MDVSRYYLRSSTDYKTRLFGSYLSWLDCNSAGYPTFHYNNVASAIQNTLAYALILIDKPTTGQYLYGYSGVTNFNWTLLTNHDDYGMILQRNGGHFFKFGIHSTGSNYYYIQHSNGITTGTKLKLNLSQYITGTLTNVRNPSEFAFLLSEKTQTLSVEADASGYTPFFDNKLFSAASSFYGDVETGIIKDTSSNLLFYTSTYQSAAKRYCYVPPLHSYAANKAIASRFIVERPSASSQAIYSELHLSDIITAGDHIILNPSIRKIYNSVSGTALTIQDTEIQDTANGGLIDATLTNPRMANVTLFRPHSTPGTYCDKTVRQYKRGFQYDSIMNGGVPVEIIPASNLNYELGNGSTTIVKDHAFRLHASVYVGAVSGMRASWEWFGTFYVHGSFPNGNYYRLATARFTDNGSYVPIIPAPVVFPNDSTAMSSWSNGFWIYMQYGNIYMVNIGPNAGAGTRGIVTIEIIDPQ